jgi:protein transport protein SEC24
MKQIGGKMCVFQSIMPNLGDGTLRPRENQAIMGTPNEIKLLKPEIPWYKDTAVEFSRQQISVDMFLFPYQYMDVSALSELPRYTAGSLFSYVGYTPEKTALGLRASCIRG